VTICSRWSACTATAVSDLVCCDPPYNTGLDWRYNDKWDTDPNDPGLGDWVGADDPGRHSVWMKFMLPRLQMMRSLLNS
jgi:adenine-specific DNA-methyltransferase